MSSKREKAQAILKRENKSFAKGGYLDVKKETIKELKAFLNELKNEGLNEEEVLDGLYDTHNVPSDFMYEAQDKFGYELTNEQEAELWTDIGDTIKSYDFKSYKKGGGLKIFDKTNKDKWSRTTKGKTGELNQRSFLENLKNVNENPSKFWDEQLKGAKENRGDKKEEVMELVDKKNDYISPDEEKLLTALITKKLSKGGKIKATYSYTDDWSQLVYKGDNGRYYVVVDGLPHATTSEGEALYPVNNVELLNTPKDTGVSFMSKGGKTWELMGNYHQKEMHTYDPNIDYFSEYTLLPQNVVEIITESGDLETYKETELLLDKLQEVGWTFEYDLGNAGYGLRPIGTDFNSYAKGGKVEVGNWDSFFEDNPDKVLGKYVDVKTKFGKKANVLKGDETEVLLKIDTPDYRLEASKNFGTSESEEEITPNTIEFNERQTAKENLKKDKQDIVDLNTAEADGTIDTALYTFDEVDKEYNVGITDMQKCAFVMYLEKKSKQNVKGGFEKYSGLYSMGQLMDKGELFYDYENREFQPRFLFQSGNIALKRLSLQSNKEKYISEFTEKRFNKATETLEEAYKIVRAKKLTLDNPVEKLRLKILLGSNFAKETFIDNYIHPRSKKEIIGFDVYASKTQDGNIKGYKLLKVAERWDNRHKANSMNLANAFMIWLKEAGDPNMAKQYGLIYRNGMSAQQILAIYMDNRNRPKDMEKADWLRIQGYAKENGDRLFSQFLAEGLSRTDRVRVETLWNDKYNSTIEYDTNKVPIGFRFTKFIGVDKNDIRPEKRNAIAYYMMRGSCLFAYGVGIGKTWCSIFTIAQAMDLGLSKRPLIVVPKQVYTQFSKEIINILGNQYKVNTLYNLSENLDRSTKKTFLEKAKSINDKTISICTYDGIENMGFSENFDMEFFGRITSILDEQNEEVSARQKEKKQEKIMEMLGKAKEGGGVDIDNSDTNFDFICVDEAHNFKKLFTAVKGDARGEQKGDTIQREKHPYKISGGVQSKRAIKLFFLTQYVQSKTAIGNCLLLTATPFTNSPLEIYSMLAYINYNYLKRIGFTTLKGFFDTFANMQSQLTINTQLKPVRKQVFVGWNNVVALQNLIFNMIDKKSREDEDKLVERPNKIVLPFRNVMKNGINYGVAEANRISTTLSMNDKQVQLAERLKEFAKGVDAMGSGVSFEELCLGNNLNETKFGKLKSKADSIKNKEAEKGEKDETMSMKELEAGEKGKTDSAGVRALQCLTYFRQLALNPYLYSCSGYNDNPTATEFVEASPKMLYAFECIKSVKDFEKENDLLTSGQVVYMDFGTDAFYLLVEYAVKELGYKENEVGYITGSDFRIGKKKQKDKSDVQDAFLGRKFNEDLQEYVNIDDSQRVKLLFGSSSIREGMNLQFYASCLYNLYIDFNPTDNTQLEGRIWRQGNRFDNVRIVVPLMENSMDIFMFQKLEEKTERINQIWNRDGQTNELNTEDFNPSELKYELITDPLTLAELQVEDDIKKFDEQIDDINLEYSTLNNFKTEYVKVEDLDVVGHNARNIYDKPVGYIYKYLSAFRPDLVPLSLIKDNTLLDGGDYKTRADRNNHYNMGWEKITNESQLNYTPQELIEKVVEFHRDQKFSFPKGYTPDVDFEIGDKVFYETKRGKKKAVIENINEGGYDRGNSVYKTYDLEVGKDDYIDEVLGLKLSLQKPKKVELLFNPFTKDRSNINAKYKWGGDQEGKDFYDIGNYIDNQEDLDKLTKWADFMDYMKTKGKYNRGWRGDSVWWSVDFPLAFKRLAKAEAEFLKPRGLNNKADLEAKLLELTANMDDLAVQKKALTEQENLQESANIIQAKRDTELAMGIRKPSTYKARAEEFMSSNADYKGNDYLLVLSEKYLAKNIESIELLRQSPKYKELSKKDQKKLEKKVVSRLKLAKTKATSKKKKETSKGLSPIEKRIMALNLIAKIKPNDKKIAQKIKLLKKINLKFKK